MNNQRDYEQELNLIDYLKIIYKYRKLIVGIVFLSMLSTFAWFFCQPKLYEAYATFFPMNMNYTIQSDSFIAKPKLDIEDLIISILESRKMTEKVNEDLNLKENDFKIETKISVNNKGIIKLSVQTRSPELSSKIANAYVDNLDYFNRQLDIGAQRQIVQVIDRASVPEKRMARGTIGKTVKSGLVSFMGAVCFVLFLEFIKKNDIMKRLKEK